MTGTSNPGARSAGRGRDGVVCDDDPMVRRIVVAVLQRCGYTAIETTAVASEAIALAEAMQPSVIVLDLALEDESGLDAMPHLLRVAPRSPIVVYSSADSMKQKARDAGAYALIDKVSLTNVADLETVIRSLDPPAL